MKEMRRKDRQLEINEVEDILMKNVYGVLSIMCEEGYPYGVPMSYTYDLGRLYFHHTADKGLLGDSIVKETKACFTVVCDTMILPSEFSTKYASVIAFGKIKECTDKMDVLMRLVKRLCPDFEEQGQKCAGKAMDKVRVYEFDIDSMTGKSRR